MNNELMEQYALIDSQIKALTNQKDELKVQIVQDFIAQGIDKVETGLGKFTISKLKTWTYPGYVEDAKEAYKTLQAKAEQTGEASFSESESLRFTPAKF
jgi:hypothetical protein